MNNFLKIFIFILLMNGAIYAQITNNENMDSALNSGTKIVSYDIDSNWVELQNMLTYLDSNLTVSFETDYQKLSVFDRIVLNKIKTYDTLNFTIIDNYPTYTFKNKLINGRNVRLMLNIFNYYNLDSIPDISLWKNSKTHLLGVSIANGTAFVMDWNDELIKLCVLEYMYNVTSSQEEWTHPINYKVDDVVVFRKKIYVCKYNHTSQINIMPGSPGIWYWDYITDVEPDLYNVTFYNIDITP